MTLEGFDLVAFGATTPLLLDYRPWHVSIAFVGLLGSLTPIGMLVGSLLVGQFTDRFGRRRTTLISIGAVSAGMFACAVAPVPSLFGAGRFVVGLAMSLLADRAGSRGPITACFVLGAAAIVAMSTRLPLPVLYAIVIVGGCGAVGVQGLINVYISRSYPVTARAGAVGVALGVGRIGAIAGPTLGGWILAAGLQPRWNFILFAVPAVPAVLGAALTLAAGGRAPRNQGRPAPSPRAKEPTAGQTQ
ncbi:MFS transporter [Streptomyces violaceusniger]